MIQGSRTKKGQRYTTKLSIVTLWTLFYVPVLVWNLLVVEPEHILWQFWTNIYSSWCMCGKCCASLLRTATDHDESFPGHWTDVHNHYVSTWYEKGECHSCLMRHNGTTTNYLDCESGRLVDGKSSWCLLAVCRCRRRLPWLLPLWPRPNTQHILCPPTSLDSGRTYEWPWHWRCLTINVWCHHCSTSKQYQSTSLCVGLCHICIGLVGCYIWTVSWTSFVCCPTA